MIKERMTMTQQILVKHAAREEIEVGQIIEVDVDMVLGNDITTPVAIESFLKTSVIDVFDKSKISIVPDHFSPNKDIKSAEQCKKVREFAKRFDIDNYFELGQMGIEHALLPEKGLIKPSEIIIGADSHTCTFGALNAFSTGIGSTDMGVAMATGRIWFKVPSAIKVNIIGKPQKWVSGKDVILNLIGKIGVSGANYKSLEFYGDGLKYLSIDDRFTITNMVIEAGAKNGIFPFDEITKAYLDEHCDKKYEITYPNENAEFESEITIDLSKLKLTVAFPHLPENTHEIDEINEKIKVDQVMIGSCTNGRISDLQAAYKILKGKKINPSLRVIIIPATQKIYLDALKNGYIEEFIKAGAIVSTPTCGPCLGGHMGVLAKDEVCISTTNRNFVGRMGHVESKVYLASPSVAAATAIKGYIVHPNEVL
ncbi:3-isopropylmalate dehydratase large subunit [Helicovermis profundi]|uniref:3-isopropylmalate dehydratase large subunit n=1 Tax=Helicovermis profundi TaxID=3065157 RepID=A0AAU9E793_9FIRM|nr:3-isopropylmalate dehydratase large subunit [Clostridia bacterium S502]